MDFDELTVHDPFETVTETRRGDAAPTVNVMAGVPWPLVMEPFVTDQLYVTPTPPFGTEAETPVVRVQRAEGAVITAEGAGTTVTVPVPVPGPAQFESTTVGTVYVVVEDGVTDRVAGLEPMPL
jgi:hypothetical protein